jgi:hypothetical protein
MRYLLFLAPLLFLGCACKTCPTCKDNIVYVDVPVACQAPQPSKPEIGENNTETFINIVEYSKKLEQALDVCRKLDSNQTNK